MDRSLNPHLEYSLAEIRRWLHDQGEHPHRLSDSEVLERFFTLRDRHRWEPLLGRDSGDPPKKKQKEEPAPPPEEVDEKNWIFLQHLRKRLKPEDRSPDGRENTEEALPVPSTAYVYQGDSLIKKVTLPADDSKDSTPVKVPVPPGSYEVVYREDYGGAYEIVDKPFDNPFADATKPPSPGQLYLLKHLRKIGV